VRLAWQSSWQRRRCQKSYDLEGGSGPLQSIVGGDLLERQTGFLKVEAREKKVLLHGLESILQSTGRVVLPGEAEADPVIIGAEFEDQGVDLRRE
jgi:hypothetical protein